MDNNNDEEEHDDEEKALNPNNKIIQNDDNDAANVSNNNNNNNNSDSNSNRNRQERASASASASASSSSSAVRIRVNVEGGTPEERFRVVYNMTVRDQQCCCCFPLKCGCFTILILALIGDCFGLVRATLMLFDEDDTYVGLAVTRLCILGLSVVFICFGLAGVSNAIAEYILAAMIYLLFQGFADFMTVIIGDCMLGVISVSDIMTVSIFLALDIYYSYVLYRLFVIVKDLRSRPLEELVQVP